MAIKISLKQLLEAGAHFGHQARRWNPKMDPYLYGTEEGIHVFDLVKTKEALEEALSFLTEAAKEGKVILLLGSKKQAKEKIIEIGTETGVPYVSERWLGGTLTNFEMIKRSLTKLSEMKAKMAAGEYNKFTKKERLLLEREIARLERFFGGMISLEKTPDVIFIVDTHKEIGAVKEARKSKITVVGIVDSNADPTLIDYPIPMNDDAAKAVDYVLGLVKEAIVEGKKKIKKVEKEEK
ncbi:MAG: 30S ribosomal protein S2 [Candidatus Woesebacteria bacterium GW2011_GWC2_47_16]|uniref:Small ribosomal subunit protein uS2 n=9 Tax=Candidatus Woeseibacteriota TaxID=1752722 RepID=A0A0G1QQ08_9BACT|nr:MAG: 30S ribosomal protein S2 [Candidatus Woesebacteria bacterium GW2011_GWE1_45_18]KKU25252.1 MAG: 30S ribosomal protein S2 [Candidatus Woesebacteria bacterium GW2011_GWF1_46_13]KKU47029.1 MAG: 30S ribosomal protein S2 [Candidatus Woesebacteria bacterium GW2011_GWF2_46_8]KKU65235.1 MAG: 30S ribosomal protein S2 [Candidatus Woesebacteria bacterium GW2011_GWC2_47_16]KKU71059.1 MAG: 30S ribosomal protein S2 [Candidatus Woesebacteria bacterium GW2011_GWD1_47_21]OGM77998.1 MAG: 30S ribosomal pr